MGDACRLPLDEFAEEGEFDVVGHDVRRAVDLALLHEHLEVGHDLVFELLKPFVQFHVVLVCTRIVVLPPARLAPVGLGELEGAGDLAVEDAVPLGCLLVEFHGKDARLDAQLQHGASVGVGRAEDALMALVAAGSAARDVAEFGPWQVVSEHVVGGGWEEVAGRETESVELPWPSEAAFLCVLWECSFHLEGS